MEDNQDERIASTPEKRGPGRPPKAENRNNRDAALDVRGSRGATPDADDRNSQALDDDEFERLIQDEFEQTALPNPPLIPGYHVVWLTTSSQYDSMQKRQRLGYTPIRQDELPSFDVGNAVKSTSETQWGGYIMCNEMILCKIPEARYQQLMSYFHHKKPLEDEKGIVDKMNSSADSDSNGKNLLAEKGDGITAMEEEMRIIQRKGNPIFS